MTKKSVLTLGKKPCLLGKALNGRTEHHGDDDVPACDIAIENLVLQLDDIEALLGEQEHQRFFKKTRNSGMDGFLEVADFVARTNTPFVLADKFAGSRVVLFLGLGDDELALEDCRLAKIKYAPIAGGVFSVSLQVQTTPDAAAMAQLFANMNRQIHAKIRFGQIDKGKSDKQPELALDPTEGDVVLNFPGRDSTADDKDDSDE